MSVLESSLLPRALLPPELEDRVPANSSVVIDLQVDKVERDLVFNFLNQISSGTFRRG